jgi:enoyl-CoA hydratase/carnithine racemase
MTADGKRADSMSEPVDYRCAAEVAWVTLNRPHRLNAITEGLVAGLVDALRQAGDDGARVIVLRGAGTSFCAGHDLRERQPPYTFERADQLQAVTRAMRDLAAPVIAAVQGYAIGGGFEFVLASDIVIAADSAQFQSPEVDVGLSATGGATMLLPRAVGPIRAKRLMLLGDRISAQEAHDLGLVTVLVPTSELDECIEALVGRLLGKPIDALMLATRAIDRGLDSTLEEALALEVDHLVRLSSSDDALAAAERFRASGSTRPRGKDAARIRDERTSGVENPRET